MTTEDPSFITDQQRRDAYVMLGLNPELYTITSEILIGPRHVTVTRCGPVVDDRFATRITRIDVLRKEVRREHLAQEQG